MKIKPHFKIIHMEAVECLGKFSTKPHLNNYYISWLAYIEPIVWELGLNIYKKNNKTYNRR